MRVATVVGNRPQFVKAAAVSPHLGERADELLIHAGQHYDRELSQVFFEELRLPAPDRVLTTGSGSHAEQTARLLRELEPVLAESEVEAVLVYGDTNTTLAAALVAAKLCLPLAHVEAGMRSFDRTMPEEVNRVAADSLSGLLLCSTPVAIENLRREGLAAGARLVGDVMADVVRVFGPIAERRSTVLEELGLEPGAYGVATVHREDNVTDTAALSAVVMVLERIAESLPLVLPAHPRTAERLRDSGLAAALPDSIRLVDPLGYLDFSKLLAHAAVALTDSGGVQKEACLAGVPCLTLRERTEWVETVESGCNRLVGRDPEAAAEAWRALSAEAPRTAPDLYGGGAAGERVAEEIASWLAGTPADRR